jgi:acyl-CoA thioesterase
MNPKRETRNNELSSILTKIENRQLRELLGNHITKIARGYAQTNLTVTERMLNFDDFAHGGLIYSLADVAFSAACNSFNQTAVALSFHVAYRRPVPVNTRLVAEAVEESSGKSTALHKIVVN